MIIWDVDSAKYGSPEYASLLAKGWEPFAVYPSNTAFLIFFRVKRDNGE